MDKIKLDKLKVAANQFYLNLYTDQPSISDKEYDQLVDEYKAEGGDVKSLIEFDSENIVMESLIEEPLDKERVEDNNFKDAITKAILKYGSSFESDAFGYINPKYDGCGIKAIYYNGRLQRIQSTPDETFGILRTEAFWNLFPHELEDKSIIALRGEVLVDATIYGELARNKANGLTNSKYKTEEVESECFIRIYKVQFKDETSTKANVRQKIALDNLPIIFAKRDRKGYLGVRDAVFAPATRLPLQVISNEMKPFVTEYDATFQMDGLVLYNQDIVKGFKFYYTQSATTEVTNVIWNQKDNGSFAAVVEFNGVELGDKWIERASSGGVNNLMGVSDNSPGAMGIGAEVKVILANTTIPKIIEVMKPSDNFNWPTCGCGYKLSEKDIFGSVLKCQNKGVCSDKYKRWKPQLIQWILDMNWDGSVSDMITEHPIWFCWSLFIDRWDPESKWNPNPEFNDQKITAEAWHKAINDNDIEGLKNMIANSFNISDLQWDTLEVNIATSIKILSDIYRMNNNELKIELNKLYDS